MEKMSTYTRIIPDLIVLYPHLRNEYRVSPAFLVVASEIGSGVAAWLGTWVVLLTHLDPLSLRPPLFVFFLPFGI